MRRILVAAVAAVLSAGVALGPAGAASAAKVVIDDGKSDTWSDVWDDDTGAWVYTEAGSTPNTDVVRTTVTHSATAVRFKVKYADLAKDASAPTYRGWLKVSSGDRAMLTVWYDPDTDEIDLFLWRPDAAHPKAVCPGVTGAIDWTSDTLTGEVPGSCLGDPAWVKFHGNSLTMDESDPRSDNMFQDVANGAGYDPDELLVSKDCFSKCEGWTGRIRHG